MATVPYLPSDLPHSFGGVLVASGDAARRDQIISTLHTDRWPVIAANGGADALGKLESTECDLLLLDRSLPDLDADEFLRIVKKQYPGIEVVELGAPVSGGAGTAAADMLQMIRKIASTDEANEIAEVTPITTPVQPLPGMVGRSEAMQCVYRMVRLVAARNTTVLVNGPTGSGKELVARALHDLSPRAPRPFVPINCAAIPEALLESELFGYSRGAFTGAVQSRIGRIQAAQTGTLFLDEIGDLPVGLQAKLLRFLESGEIQRLGSSESMQVDVRVVAATNAELFSKVKSGEFRQDLYFRLSVFPIELPGLADHKSDIAELAQHALIQLGAGGFSLSDAAHRKLTSHSWPGNVRELRHVLERAVIMAEQNTTIRPDHIQFGGVAFNRD